MVLSNYLITRYLGYFGLCSVAFLGLVLTTRFHEIASFAAFGAGGIELFLFIFLQFPYILPAVIPISALVASYLLSRQLSERFELLSLRASGLSIAKIFRPIFGLSVLLVFCNFILVSEISTWCHLQTRLLEKEFKGVNPLVLLKHPELIRMKGIEIITLGELEPGERASQLVIAAPNAKQKRLLLFLADELKRDQKEVIGSEVTFLSCGPRSDHFPEIIMDHAKVMRTKNESFSRVFRGETSKVSLDYLGMPLLLYRLKEAVDSGDRGLRTKALSDIIRRISLSLEPLTLTLFGLSFGLMISRRQEMRSTFIMILLAALNITCIFLAKSFYKNLLATALLYSLPHPLLLYVAFRRFKRIERGIEC